MAFVVEDGTIVTDANSLCAVAVADAYFADRGVAAWTGTSTVKEQALVRGTDYVINRFRFRGSQVEDDQPLPFPRVINCEDVGNPDKVQQAVAEYALRALSAALAPDPSYNSGGSLKRTTKIIGPIENTIEYQDGSVPPLTRAYPAADRLLRDYIVPGGGVTR